MAFTTESKSAPSVATSTGPTSAQSARERAIAILSGATPAVNQNNIAPEEAAAVRPPSQKAQLPSNEDTTQSLPDAETKAPDEPLSSQYAMLARKEKAIRQREQQLRTREAAIKQREAPPTAPQSPQNPAFDESKYISKERLSKDPFGALTEMGMTYDQLTEAALNGPAPKEIAMMAEMKAMREELNALKGESESTKKSFETQKSDSYNQSVAQIRLEAKNLIAKDPNFETVRETNSLSDVVELIEQTFKEDGILLTVEEAATQVEEYLLEEATKLYKIKKLQQRLKLTASQPATQQTQGGKQQPMKTLTNAVGTSRSLTGRERALLAFEGKLGK